MWTLLKKLWSDEATAIAAWSQLKPMLLRVAIAAGGILVNQGALPGGETTAGSWASLLVAVVGPFFVKANLSLDEIVAALQKNPELVAKLRAVLEGDAPATSSPLGLRDSGGGAA